MMWPPFYFVLCKTGIKYTQTSNMTYFGNMLALAHTFFTHYKV